MRRLLSFARDRSGVSAIEFALIAPAFALVVIYSIDGWMMIQQSLDMRTAVQTAARYYEIGGGDDPTAQSLALAAWRNKPQASSLGVSRTCACDGVTASCTASCNGLATVTATILASSSYNGSVFHRSLNEKQVVRVQ
jgi:Flp pilus assembly protein TadG